ncbi:DUF6629 family protein [Haliscomenobacter hydrossis]|uniref:Uncharacterized protein n=1 Tax=Haliscomenobacter hydrossis (strain ATCC 27775 / DSM 1100 / LMG 10767 / O) TaxID=760192 RepID=F4L5B9_HALH1|nr:DUF6629 family protein [Haliscomenobacter hydrossis]AEE49799.1 hypothetical protein Halhy_1914 [Haliscomenobacter hydrossis DSM 1100]
MCFSATASFGASAVLTGIGIFAASKVKEPQQRAFAAIPFIFAVQQFTEGFVWLSLTQASWAEWIRPSSFIFLFFAEVLWPMWIPFAMLVLEKDQRTRRFFRIALALGFIFGMHTLYYLLSNTYDVRIADHHVLYKLHFPLTFVVFTWIAYGIGTVMPTFISTVPKMWVFGLPMALSFLVALFFYPSYVISVWCFFAALMSGFVVVVLMGEREKGK